ncbi:MAG: adenosine deaminase [Candidatus Abyssubacteria bacterium]
MSETQRNNLERAIERMPKAELHVHLEGSISSKTIEKLAQKNSVDLGRESHRQSGRGYGHLINFLDDYRLRCRCLRSPEDFKAACVDVLENLRSQHVRYAELTMAPTVHRLNGLSMDDIMPGLEAGVKAASGNGNIEVRFILDVGRQFGQDHAWQTVRDAARHQASGVIALGLGGDEIHYSPELYVEQFAWARKQGLHVVAHAGEVGGPSSVWGAVKSLRAERIGHGLSARGDDELLEYLRIARIPVEMCPTSNVQTGAIRSYSEHPLPLFLRRGLLVTLNSDDPAMFGASLTHEYKVCHERLGLGWEEIKMLGLNAVRGSFLPDLDKQRLLEDFERELARIEDEERLA